MSLSRPPATPLPPPVDGAQLLRLGDLACWTAGEAGPPLLLVHSVNAAASAAEVRPLFDHARATRRVFALELPGFGHSARGDRDYTPRLMTDAVLAAVAEMHRRCGAAPIDALAVSLGCEFLARAASEQPALFRRLAFVSPTGFNGRAARRGPPGGTRKVPLLGSVLGAPLWAQGLFDNLTRPGVVRFFLEKTFGAKAIDERMWAYAVATARQPGARFAPLAFLGGGLFSADITAVYESLSMPVWACHGQRGDFTDYRGLAFVKERPNWRINVLPTGALPYFEMAAEFGAEMDRFFAHG